MISEDNNSSINMLSTVVSTHKPDDIFAPVDGLFSVVQRDSMRQKNGSLLSN